MDESYIYSLLQRYHDGQCTPEEQRAVERWYEALGADRPEPTLTAAQEHEVDARLWARIAAQTGATPQPARLVPPARRAAWRRPAWQWAAAASVAVGTALGTWWLRPVAPGPDTARTAAPAAEWVVAENPGSRAIRLALPDGSAVTLAPTSRLRYPRSFRGSGRSVTLSGEAFFSVAHDASKPFRVYTDQVVTTVLGTSFRVRAFAGQATAQVDVRTGRVRVAPNAAAAGAAALPAAVVVLPNQRAEYSPARHRLTTGLVAQPVLLSEQPLAFDDRPVAEVVAALEKAYGVRIVYDRAALAHCTVSLVLNQQTLFGKLNVLCKVLGGSYKQVGTQLVVQAKGCPKE